MARAAPAPCRSRRRHSGTSAPSIRERRVQRRRTGRSRQHVAGHAEPASSSSLQSSSSSATSIVRDAVARSVTSGRAPVAARAAARCRASRSAANRPLTSVSRCASFGAVNSACSGSPVRPLDPRPVPRARRPRARRRTRPSCQPIEGSPPGRELEQDERLALCWPVRRCAGRAPARRLRAAPRWPPPAGPDELLGVLLDGIRLGGTSRDRDGCLADEPRGGLENARLGRAGPLIDGEEELGHFADRVGNSLVKEYIA